MQILKSNSRPSQIKKKKNCDFVKNLSILFFAQISKLLIRSSDIEEWTTFIKRILPKRNN